MINSNTARKKYTIIKIDYERKCDGNKEKIDVMLNKSEKT